MDSPPLNHRRTFLKHLRNSFATIPLLYGLKGTSHSLANEGQQLQGPVKRVIFLFMNGGPSQLDTFDPKPALDKYDGKSYTGETKIGSGNRVVGTLWKSPFQFNHCGDSGIEISELYPHLSQLADDLCVIRSMQASSSLHATALLEINTGNTRVGFPSLGAWIDSAFSPLNQHLPSSLIMLDQRGLPINGNANWSNSGLNASFPYVLNSIEHPGDEFASSRKYSDLREGKMRDLLRAMNQSHLKTAKSDLQLQQRINSYEDAWNMQQELPEAFNLANETVHTQRRYGLHEPHTIEFGTRCLMARRLLERGVQFLQIYSGGGAQEDTWDSHTGNNERHRKFTAETDLPIAALLKDLKDTGLWEDTLVIWGGEFGRTPTREANSNGRDHNPHGFSMFLAGGAVKSGQVIGATDEIGFEAVENACHVHDLHATILHLMGLDHTELKSYQNGQEISLTGPTPCRVIEEVLA